MGAESSVAIIGGIFKAWSLITCSTAVVTARFVPIPPGLGTIPFPAVKLTLAEAPVTVF